MPNDTQQTTHMEPFEDWLRSSTHPSIHKWSDKLIELGASWDTFQRDVDETILDLQTAGIPLLAAKDISQVVKEALHRSEVPLSIFWDIENVPIPNEVSGTRVATRLKEILAQHGQLKQFRGYASIGLNHIPESKRSELQLSGCHLVDCPHAGRKEVADKMIIVDALEFAFSNPRGATLCFITSDLDYAYLLAKLQQRPQWTTIVISKGTMQSLLQVNCDMKMRWETDVLRMTPMASRHSGVDDDSIISDSESIFSLEALTPSEEWLDDAELLRSILTKGTPVAGESSSGILKSFVGDQLRKTNPARFPDRSSVKNFLAKAIEENIVEETIDGEDRILHISLEAGGVRPPISLCDRAPLPLDVLPDKLLQLAETMPFVLFIKKVYIPGGTHFPNLIVQSASDMVILVFRKLTYAQRTVDSMPFLRHGVLIDWRTAIFPKPTDAQVAAHHPCNGSTAHCVSCDAICLKSKLFAEPGSSDQFCQNCFEKRSYWIQSEATKATERVVHCVQIFAENGDMWAPVSVIRSHLKERWPIDAAVARGNVDHWIACAVEAGAIVQARRPDKQKARVLFLPENAKWAMAPYLSDDIDTSEEEEQVVQWLNENRGTMTRMDMNSKLKEKFERMNSPPMITRLYSSAAAKGSFFVERGPSGQMVGLTKTKARYAYLLAAAHADGLESDSPALPDSDDDTRTKVAREVKGPIPSQCKKQAQVHVAQ